MPRLPARWENYTKMGEVIPGTRIITFKVPLGEHLGNGYAEKLRFTPTNLLEMTEANGMPLGLIIDLTFTDRYYRTMEFTNQGVQHSKIFVPGHVIPSDKIMGTFSEVVDAFLANPSYQDKFVGVHCTHGVNRTGYIVGRYMIERLGMDPEEAIAAIGEARGYPIERENYLADLRRRPLKSYPTKFPLVGRVSPTSSQPMGTDSARKCCSCEAVNDGLVVLPCEDLICAQCFQDLRALEDSLECPRCKTVVNKDWTPGQQTENNKEKTPTKSGGHQGSGTSGDHNHTSRHKQPAKKQRHSSGGSHNSGGSRHSGGGYNDSNHRGGHKRGYNRDGYDNSYNHRGGYDNSYNHRGGYDNSYNHRGGYDNSYNHRGGYDNSYNHRGGYDNSYNHRGGYDNSYNHRGGYDNSYNHRGGYDNSYNRRGGYDNRYNQNGGQQGPTSDYPSHDNHHGASGNGHIPTSDYDNGGSHGNRSGYYGNRGDNHGVSNYQNGSSSRGARGGSRGGYQSRTGSAGQGSFEEGGYGTFGYQHGNYRTNNSRRGGPANAESRKELKCSKGPVERTL